MKLIKCSLPGWTKVFEDEGTLKQQLYQHLCGICQEGETMTDNEGNIVYEADPVGPDATIDEMLSTACGLEFEVEKD